MSTLYQWWVLIFWVRLFCHLLISSWCLRALRKQNGSSVVEAANSSLSLFFCSLHTEYCFSEQKYELLWPKTALGENVTRDCSSLNSTWTGMQDATRFRDLTFSLRKAGGDWNRKFSERKWVMERRREEVCNRLFVFPLSSWALRLLTILFSLLALFNVAIRLTSVTRLCFTWAPWPYFYIETLWAYFFREEINRLFWLE